METPSPEVEGSYSEGRTRQMHWNIYQRIGGLRRGVETAIKDYVKLFPENKKALATLENVRKKLEGLEDSLAK